MVTVELKPYSSIEELIAKLVDRGMILDPAFAGQWLRSVGYYRLSACWYPYRQFTSEDPTRRGDDFEIGTQFVDVAGLYEFDRKMRTLIHDGIERIEVALRTQLSEHLGAIGGPLAYKEPEHFRLTFHHTRWLQKVEERVERARRRSEAIRHHNTKYSGKLPIWVLSEVLDFTDVSLLYDGLPTRSQWFIASQLGIDIDNTRLTSGQRKRIRKQHPLARWFEQLTVVRNTTAHHSRLWNRSFVPAGTGALQTVAGLELLPEGQSEHLYGTLCVSALLTTISPGTSWPRKVRQLIEGSFLPIAGRDVAEMGFPEGWKDEPFWNTPPLDDA